MSPLVSRPTGHDSPRWGVCVSAQVLTLLCSAVLGGCSLSQSHYFLVDKSLLTSDYQQADDIIRQAEKDYGSKSRVLYGMDRGMTLQLAGEYDLSNQVLEEAEEEVDRLYTRTVRTETAAFMTNDNTLPYEGEPYEQVMINVLKALNYASMNRWQDALVEARRIDHRLNVLADRITNKTAYRDDGFARYLRVSSSRAPVTSIMRSSRTARRMRRLSHLAVGRAQECQLNCRQICCERRKPCI